MIRRLFTIGSAISLLLCVTLFIVRLTIGSGHRRLWLQTRSGACSRVEVDLHEKHLRFRSIQSVHSAAAPISRQMLPAWLGRVGVQAADGPGDYVMAARIEGGPATYDYQLGSV